MLFQEVCSSLHIPYQATCLTMGFVLDSLLLLFNRGMTYIETVVASPQNGDLARAISISRPREATTSHFGHKHRPPPALHIN